MALLAISCARVEQGKEDRAGVEPLRVEHPEYAKLFYVEQYQDYAVLCMVNPWDTAALLKKYYLVEEKSVKTPLDGERLVIPLQKVAINSASYVGFLAAIDKLDEVTGACQIDLIYNEAIQKRYQKGEIKELGNSFAISYEQLLSLSPHALFLSALNTNDGVLSRIKESHIPIVYISEWMEENVLGRAEWIKVFALLMGEKAKGDSLFAVIENNYLTQKKAALDYPQGKNILPGLPYKNVWYMPGGKSFMSELFAAAKGDYLFKDNASSGSLQLNLEYVISHFKDAEIWLGVDVKTKQELEAIDKRLLLFDALKNDQVYHYQKRSTPKGGNDFWETGTVRPDLLLSDIIQVLHSDNPEADSLYFLQKIN